MWERPGAGWCAVTHNFHSSQRCCGWWFSSVGRPLHTDSRLYTEQTKKRWKSFLIKLKLHKFISFRQFIYSYMHWGAWCRAGPITRRLRSVTTSDHRNHFCIDLLERILILEANSRMGKHVRLCTRMFIIKVKWWKFR